MVDGQLRPLVVIPAFNEAEVIAQTISELRAADSSVSVLIVDDGSRDHTFDIAAAQGVRVARLPFNLGVGGAMRFGFRYAALHGFDAVVQLDADGQHDPRYLGELLAGLTDADVVIGARFAGAGDYQVRGPRKWAMALLAGTISRTAGVRLTDTTSGFRASGPRAVRLFADDYPAEYLGDTVESLVTGLRSGLTVRQVPVAMRPRQGGQPSQNAWRSTVFLFRALIALVFAYIRPRLQNGVS